MRWLRQARQLCELSIRLRELFRSTGYRPLRLPGKLFLVWLTHHILNDSGPVDSHSRDARRHQAARVDTGHFTDSLQTTECTYISLTAADECRSAC